MTPSSGRSLFDADEDRIEHQHEVVAPRRSLVGLVVSIAAVAGLGYLVVTGGSSDDGDRSLPAPTSSTTIPPTTPLTTAPPAAGFGLDSSPGDRSPSPLPSSPPVVSGSTSNGLGYRVEERLPGVLCVSFESPAAAEDRPADTCHHELVTASGPAVIDDTLVFGYLPPGSASVAIRYRSGNVGNDGIRVEQRAQFFALPINGTDAYRIQYRAPNLAVTDEIPLVGLPGGPSQGPVDAARDGVPADIAALAFNRRVDPIEEWTYLTEGPYVWSRLAERSIDDRWGEVLLLDETGTRIIRSTPLPGVQLTARLDLEDTVFLLGRQIATPFQAAVDRGEVAFPIVVASIDRTTGASLVRIFPRAEGGAEPIEPDLTRPGWSTGPPLPEIDPDRIGATDQFLQIEAVSGGTSSTAILLDRNSLSPISEIPEIDANQAG